MNTQKNVNQRLSKLYSKDTKQELSSEKVELALDGELKSQGQKAQSIFNDGRKNAIAQIQKAGDEMGSAKKKLEALLKDIDNAYSKAKKTADEIGVDLDSTSVGKSFKQTYSEVEDFVISAGDLRLKLLKIRA